MFTSFGSADYKQHLNLSEHAYEVIQNDIRSFMVKPSLSGFLNRVIEEYQDYADASISIALKRKRESLQQLLKGLKDSPDKGNIIEKLVEQYKKKLMDQVSRHPKGIYVKFRLNKKNFTTLFEEECPEGVFYDSQGKYIKAIIEEYTSKSPLEREQIFWGERLTFIQNCIDNGTLLKLKTRQNWIYEVKPYAIRVDGSGLYHYLIGIASSPAALDTSPRISSFRIALLEEIGSRSKSYRSGKVTQIEKRQIEEQIQQKGVQFLLGNAEEILVKLDRIGKKMFTSQLHLRPLAISINDDIYQFNCTQSQIEFYFFKFGSHAEVISPQELRERFALKYHEASAIYGDYHS